jgi:hypothetical protein
MPLVLNKTSKFGSFLALNLILKNNSYAKNGVENKPVLAGIIKKEVTMDFTPLEKEILNRAFYLVNDFFTWSDLDGEEGFDFEDDIYPAIVKLLKKLGIEEIVHI